MKNKKSIYILLLVVLLIWGLVIYNFVSWSPSGTPDIAEPGPVEAKPLDIVKRDTLILDADYRDPFLGKMHRPGNTVTDAVKRKVKKQEPVVWPALQYKGIVSDNKDKIRVYMVVINGQAYLMGEKETAQEVTLKKGDRQSVTLSYKGRTTTILIAE